MLTIITLTHLGKVLVQHQRLLYKIDSKMLNANDSWELWRSHKKNNSNAEIQRETHGIGCFNPSVANPTSLGHPWQCLRLLHLHVISPQHPSYRHYHLSCTLTVLQYKYVYIYIYTVKLHIHTSQLQTMAWMRVGIYDVCLQMQFIYKCINNTYHPWSSLYSTFLSKPAWSPGC